MASDLQGTADKETTAEIVRKSKSGFDSIKEAGIGIGIMVLLLIVCLSAVITSVYTIHAGHQGVIFRFGRFAGIAKPGLHSRIPFDVDKVIEVNTEKIETETFGFRSGKPGVRYRPNKDSRSMRESMLLTSDLSIIELEWVVHYKRQDPKKFVFSIHDPIQSIRDTGECTLRKIIGNCTFDYALQNREELSQRLKNSLQKELDGYKSGIKIVDVRFQNVLPPDAVRESVREANAAMQQKDSLIKAALADYNQQVPKARGEAEGIVHMAQGYALERVNIAKGETSRFNDVLKEYRNAREVTKKRLYLETCKDVIPKAKQVYVIDSKQKNFPPLIGPEINGTRKGGGE